MLVDLMLPLDFFDYHLVSWSISFMVTVHIYNRILVPIKFQQTSCQILCKLNSHTDSLIMFEIYLYDMNLAFIIILMVHELDSTHIFQIYLNKHNERDKYTQVIY